MSRWVASGLPDLTTPAARDADAVVLTGVDFGDWAVPSNQTARLPLVDLACGDQGGVPEDPTDGGAADVAGVIDTSDCNHSQYSTPDADTSTIAAPAGTRVQRRGLRQLGRPVRAPVRRQPHERGRPGLPLAVRAAAVLPVPVPPEHRPRRPDVRRRQRVARLVAGLRAVGHDRRPHSDDHRQLGRGHLQGLAAVPYYRDDSCFDDGTGSNPGPKLRPRSANEPQTLADGTPRKCWTPADGAVPADDPRFFQGSIATHGVHLLFLADSDNARQTVPLTEIVNEWNMVMLPGNPGNVGERYGRSFEKPLVASTQLRTDLVESLL